MRLHHPLRSPPYCGLNARSPEGLRKNDDDLTLRLLHALNGNLVPSMHLSALKEIRSPADKREFHDTFTGMRDFMGAVQELDRSSTRSGALSSTLA